MTAIAEKRHSLIQTNSPSAPIVRTTSMPIDATLLDGLTDDEIDTLSFGVICLDRTGKILRYNLAEARFARLDRAQVLGKGFFTQIAPCTSTPAFRGRFEQFTQPGATDAIVRFEYAFTFRFGTQNVVVELVRPSSANRFYVLINRKTFLPTAVDVPQGHFAPMQAELAPREEAAGVARDTQQRRRVEATPVLLWSLRSVAERGGSEQGRAFLEDWGVAWGRLACVDLEADVLESSQRLLRELPMAEAMQLMTGYLRDQGWGAVSVDFTSSKRGILVVSVERSAFAEARASQSAKPACWLLAGFFRAVFTNLAQRPLAVAEVVCRAQGHERCEFAVVGSGRSGTLVAAVADGRNDMNAVLGILRAG